MEAIHVHSWKDMAPFGINVLTGEACAYSMRLLCDLNEDGRALILEYLGLPFDTKLTANWNSQVDGKPAVGSVMLHHGSCLQIAEFAMLRSGVRAIVYKAGDGLAGIYSYHLLEQYKKLIEDWPATTGRWVLRTIGKSDQPHVGSRNIHAASGRSE